MGWLPMRAVERIVGLATGAGCNMTDVTVPDVETALRSSVPAALTSRSPDGILICLHQGSRGGVRRKSRMARKIRSDNALLRRSVQLEAFWDVAETLFSRIPPRARD